MSNSTSTSSQEKIAYFHHHGPWPTPETEHVPALRFLANYVKRIDSAEYDCSYLPYYHPRAVFHDATGVDYVSGQAIWDWIKGLFAPFEKIYMESRDFNVITHEDGTHTIFGEWMSHFWIKGTGEKVSIPRAMVFKIGKAEGEDGKDAGESGSEGEIGFEGLQIYDVRLYYDRSLLVPLLKRSQQEKEKFGS